ncbi:hypothetical protein SNEBB_005850 [Seison nebaliae]|nr:hypothetical protein SNEBB_005850 [Seison nebaliae]
MKSNKLLLITISIIFIQSTTSLEKLKLSHTEYMNEFRKLDVDEKDHFWNEMWESFAEFQKSSLNKIFKKKKCITKTQKFSIILNYLGVPTKPLKTATMAPPYVREYL